MVLAVDRHWRRSFIFCHKKPEIIKSSLCFATAEGKWIIELRWCHLMVWCVFRMNSLKKPSNSLQEKRDSLSLPRWSTMDKFTVIIKPIRKWTQDFCKFPQLLLHQLFPIVKNKCLLKCFLSCKIFNIIDCGILNRNQLSEVIYCYITIQFGFRHSSRFLGICCWTRSQTEIEAKSFDATRNPKSQRSHSWSETWWSNVV